MQLTDGTEMEHYTERSERNKQEVRIKTMHNLLDTSHLIRYTRSPLDLVY